MNRGMGWAKVGEGAPSGKKPLRIRCMSSSPFVRALQRYSARALLLRYNNPDRVYFFGSSISTTSEFSRTRSKRMRVPSGETSKR